MPDQDLPYSANPGRWERRATSLRSPDRSPFAQKTSGPSGSRGDIPRNPYAIYDTPGGTSSGRRLGETDDRNPVIDPWRRSWVWSDIAKSLVREETKMIDDMIPVLIWISPLDRVSFAIGKLRRDAGELLATELATFDPPFARFRSVRLVELRLELVPGIGIIFRLSSWGRDTLTSRTRSTAFRNSSELPTTKTPTENCPASVWFRLMTCSQAPPALSCR